MSSKQMKIVPGIILILRKWMRLASEEKSLMAEIVFFLMLSKFMMKCLPFKVIAHILKEKKRYRKKAISSEAFLDQLPKSMEKAVWGISFFKKCLTQALAAKMMLNRRGIESVVYFGVFRDENNHFQAHAWITSGTLLIPNRPCVDQFRVIKRF